MARYVGWGGSTLANGMFPDPRTKRFKKDWESLGTDLRNLLTDEEYAAARASTLNAHYTSNAIVRGMYQAVVNMGFAAGGRILEPGMGIGNFAGLMPDGLIDGTQLTGVELDQISGRIAKLLYPDWDIHVADFIKFSRPDGHFDMAIGNPPFAGIEIKADPRYRKFNPMLHDYFFMKSIDMLRPGGLLAFVTSKGTLDKQTKTIRQWIDDRADFLGAIRLPNTAFKKNAETEVTTDVIFLQRRAEGQPSKSKEWLDLAEIETPEGKTWINRFYADNPAMMLGEMRLVGTMRNANEPALVAPGGQDLAVDFARATDNLPTAIYQPVKRADGDLPPPSLSPSEIKEGAYYVEDGQLKQRQSGIGFAVPVKSGRGTKGIFAKHADIITGLVRVRDAMRQVLDVQMEGKKGLEVAQTRLAKAYDAFVKKHGPINKTIVSTLKRPGGIETEVRRTPNLTPFDADPDVYLVASIERYDEATGKAEKGDIFTKQVIAPEPAPKIANVFDALNVTLNSLGRVDIAQIAAVAGKTEQEAIRELGTAVYQNPRGGQWETEDAYLSGNVRVKLAEARIAAERNPLYQRNVQALEDVQPVDLLPSEVTPKLGMPWLGPDLIADFAQEEMGLQMDVRHVRQLGSWAVDMGFRDRTNAVATTEWGTKRRDAADLLKSALNFSQVKVYDRHSDGTSTLNDMETKAANLKLDKIKSAFTRWAFRDPERAERLVGQYNQEYNAIRPRKFDGSHLTLPGSSQTIQLRKHQKDVVWRILQTGNTYMAHGVGAGKTMAQVAALMEMRRLGLARKPIQVVPNHMLRQFATELYELYPNAKVLIADEKQFTAKNRRTFMAKVTTGDWDAIIITHSAFNKVALSQKFQADVIGEEIAEYRALKEQAKKEGERQTVKLVEAGIKRLEQRLEKRAKQVAKDRGVTFEETGIDFMVVDEAHEFRKVDFTTNQGNIKGIASAGSERGWDLFLKTRYLETVKPGKHTVLASGTMLTNTLGEIFTVQRLLQPKLLDQHGIHTFDAWAASFGEATTDFEMTPSGAHKPVTRFKEFVNLGELIQMLHEVADVVMVDDLDYIKRPDVKGGKRQIVAGERSPELAQYQQHLGRRIADIEARSGPPSPGDDIMLTVINDGRHAAIDMRFVDPSLPAQKDGKLEIMIDEVERIWREGAATKATQMVFSDLGTPSVREKRGFDVYTHTRDSLIARGVPAGEIAFMQDYKKDDAKRRLFADMNAGRKRILIGSTPTMGTGVNVQRRLKALHHLEAPWLPSSVEQREGRILRQGNSNPEIEIAAYVTKQSYDATMWQILENKIRFIVALMKGDKTLRRMEDLDGEANQAAVAKAIASGDPRVLERAELDHQIMQLVAARNAHEDEQVRWVRQRRAAQEKTPKLEADIKELEAIMARVKPAPGGDQFQMTIGKGTFTKRPDAGAKIKKDVLAFVFGLKEDEVAPMQRLGKIGDFDVVFYAYGSR